MRLFACRVFEEEDHADGVELSERLRVKRDELFELDILRAEGFNEVREDALKMGVSLSYLLWWVECQREYTCSIRLDRVPTARHDRVVLGVFLYVYACLYAIPWGQSQPRSVSLHMHLAFTSARHDSYARHVLAATGLEEGEARLVWVWLHSRSASLAFLLASHAASSRASSKATYPLPLLAPTQANQPSQPKVSLEFLQRPNSGADLPVAAPVEPLGGADPAPQQEPVEAPAPANEEETPAPVQEETPAPEQEETAPDETPAPESTAAPQTNGAPVESKPEEQQTADMSYADMAAKGPKQSDEDK